MIENSNNEKKKRKPLNTRIIIPTILIIFAVMSLISSGKNLYLVFTDDEKYTVATIKSFTSKEYTDEYDKTFNVYSPTYEYTIDGKSYSFTSDSQLANQPAIGAKATIKYNPNDYNDIKFEEKPSLISALYSLILAIIMGGLAFAFYKKDPLKEETL